MKLSEHCYGLTGLANIPPWTLNAGFIVGSTHTLVVDTGANKLSAQTIYGYARNMRPQNIIMAINTEQHLDHIGGNAYFREQGVDVYGHHKIARFSEDLAVFVEEYNNCITNPVRNQKREAELFFDGTQITNPNQLIYAETVFDLGALDVQVLLSPGHTSSNISIFVPADQLLFCGDCLVTGYIPNLESGTVADWELWLLALDKIASLQPQIVVPGHGEVLREAKIKSELERTRQVLITAIASGIAPTLNF